MDFLLFCQFIDFLEKRVDFNWTTLAEIWIDGCIELVGTIDMGGVCVGLSRKTIVLLYLNVVSKSRFESRESSYHLVSRWLLLDTR